jgi:hypothetical protein
MLKNAGKKTGLVFAALLGTLMAAVLVFSGGAYLGESLQTNLPNGKLDAFARGFSTNLPIIVMQIDNSSNDTSLYDRENPPYAALWVFDGKPENRLTDTPTDIIRSATVNYRGAASMAFPKKQYKLDLYNYFTGPLDHTLLGFPAASEWVLHSPYADKSLIRNWFAYELAAMVLDWQPRGKPVQLFVQEDEAGMIEYRGVYLLCEYVTVGESRLDLGQFRLRRSDSIDRQGGGYLFQRDRPKGNNHFRLRGIDFRLSHPRLRELGTLQNDIFINEVAFFYNFLTKKGEYKYLDADDWDYWNYIDVDSFINYFLVAELVKCGDAGSLSTYMYRPVGGKLYVGPLWDGDMSMGNFAYLDSGYDSFLTLNRDMIRHLLGDARFSEAFVERWKELRETIWSDDALLGLFDAMVGYIAPAAAQNEARWPYDGDLYKTTYPFQTATTWDEEIDQTRSWLANRLVWLDENIPLLADVENTPLLVDFEGAEFWAIEPIAGARDERLIPDTIANGEWRDWTTRLDGARAVVLLIEKASGKTKEQIALANGWDLDARPFPDTDDRDVAFLWHAGVVTGAGGAFNPEGTFTRAEFVTMIGRAAENIFGCVVGGTHSFTDVPDWASPYVAYAADNGIAKGNFGRFYPNGRLTNQETVAFVYRTYQAWR